MEGGNGGALLLHGDAASLNKLTIINCKFYNNSAVNGDGGAIFIRRYSKLIIFNSLFYNNNSGNIGGAIRMEDTQCDIINSTIIKNTSLAGGGIYDEDNSTLNVYNSIIVGNIGTVAQSNADIANYSGNTTIYNSAYQNVPLSATKVNSVIAPPTSLFTNYAANDFTLLPNCVAINGGNDNYYVNEWNTAFPTNTIVSPSQHTDLLGNNRGVCIIDMGAYESEFGNNIIPLSAQFCEGKSYDFRGKTLTQAGTYCDTVTSTENCDTIYKLTLQQIDTKHYSYKDTSYKCEWYYFGTDSLNETGIYLDTLAARNGCDSIVTLDLLVRPRIFDDTLKICPENLPITIYDTVFDKNSHSGAYTIHHRCAIITMYLTVFPSINVLLDVPENQTVCADDEAFLLNFQNQGTGIPSKYSLRFDSKAVATGFQNDILEITENNKIKIPVPDAARPDRYNVDIDFIDANNCQASKFSVPFEVHYPHYLIEQNWNDVIALLNPHAIVRLDRSGHTANEADYTFSNYQWYKGNSPIPNETRSYIYVPAGLEVGAYYMLETRRVSDGVTLFTCPIKAQPYTEQLETPIIVQSNGIISISASNDGDVRMYTPVGIIVGEGKISGGQMQMHAPTTAGIYIIHIRYNNGKTWSGVLIVRE
jgi:hypothetical protein